MPQTSCRLTDLTLKNLPIPARGQITYDDDASPLKVRVSQGGAKTFLVMIGSGKRHTIGRYGDITLQQARAAAVRLKAEKTLGRVFPEAMSLSSARELYLSQAQIRPKTRDYYVRHLGKLKAPQVRDITTRDINRILDPLPQATRTQALASIRPFFKWCLARNYIERSPCELMTGQPSTARDRVLSDTELSCIWQACESCGQFGIIVKLLILTGQRKNEIANVQSSWIKDNAITLPKGVTKNGREHTFPIGAFSVATLSQVSSSIPPTNGLLFSSKTNTGRHFSGWSKSKIALDKKLGPDFKAWTLHDLRRTFATNLAALGVRMEVTEKLLNHLSGSFGGIVGVYQRHTYMDEMRDAIEMWEKHLTKLLA